MTGVVSSSNSTAGRYATINRAADGDVIGVAIFLTGDDLEILGIDVETTDAIHVAATDGSLDIDAASEVER